MFKNLMVRGSNCDKPVGAVLLLGTGRGRPLVRRSAATITKSSPSSRDFRRALLAAALCLLIAPVLAVAQQSRPLSAPDHPPIPLTDEDQERARAAEMAKQQKDAAKDPKSGTASIVKIPGRHISSGNAVIDALANEAAGRYHLDPCLILSVMNAESGYNRMAVSPKGASGLMQLMPATATRLGVRNIFDPRENVLAGASYLRWLLDRFGGDVRLALAGYNAGEGAVELYGYKIPPFLETQNYVQVIYTRYSRIHGAAAPSPLPTPTSPLQTAQNAPVKENIPTYNQIIRFTSSNGTPSSPGQK
ncbi:MAG TPA: lytic transglycosylase domain-containing protein [Blastocatellia bacterium]|nr:lytic transglycosylase domain-containing protein [Blastocatellia bacterium]